MIKVKVPATSANMGPGFDSMGVALSLYNYISIEETKSGLEIEILDESSRFLPRNESNLTYKSMKAVFDKVSYKPKGLKIVLENNIPITRGLGSSSACIVGGILAANILSGNKLSLADMINLSASLEGHADNVAPALLGGFTVNVMQKGTVNYVKSTVKNDLRFAAFVPNFYLQTKKSRSLLPNIVPYKDAVYNTGHSALLATSLITGKYENIRLAIGDRLHQSYRKKLIPEMDKIFKMCYKSDALGVYLSGAGPTIIAIIKSENTDFETNITSILKNKMKNWHLHILQVDNEGAGQI